MLPSLVLQRTSVRPYQRGLYCGDSSLSYPYKKSTVPSSVLTAVGLTLPFVSVSPAREEGAHVSGEHRGQKRGGLVDVDGSFEGAGQFFCQDMMICCHSSWTDVTPAL